VVSNSWTTLEKVLSEELGQYLSIDIPKDLKDLLRVPFMTRKVARVLADIGIVTLEQLVTQQPHKIAQKLKLAVGFEFQVCHFSPALLYTIICFFRMLLLLKKT